MILIGDQGDTGPSHAEERLGQTSYKHQPRPKATLSENNGTNLPLREPNTPSPAGLAVCSEHSGGKGVVWLRTRLALALLGRLPLTGQTVGNGLPTGRVAHAGCAAEGKVSTAILSVIIIIVARAAASRPGAVQVFLLPSLPSSGMRPGAPLSPSAPSFPPRARLLPPPSPPSPTLPPRQPRGHLHPMPPCRSLLSIGFPAARWHHCRLARCRHPPRLPWGDLHPQNHRCSHCRCHSFERPRHHHNH